MGTNNTGLIIGQKVHWSAPSFAKGVEQQLSDQSLSGQPYILYFYPKDNTPGCTTQTVISVIKWGASRA